MWWWGLVLDAAGAVPLLLFGRKLRMAWAAHLCVMALWGAFAVTTRQYGFLPGALIYAGFDVWGWLRWRKPDEVVA